MKRLVLALTLSSLAALPLVGAAPHPSQQREESGCPEILAHGPVDVGLRDSSISFEVKHAPQGPRASVTYKWTLSAGSIVGGQGTGTIDTDLTGARNEWVEVRVEVGGLSGSCPNTVSYNLPPGNVCIRPLDSYGDIRFEDEQARLDNYAIQLLNDPTSEGHIICYGGRVGRAGEAERRCVRAKKYLVERRGIEPSRLLVVEGGYREDLTVEPWIVPAGATPPTPTATVNPTEVKFIEAKPRRPRTQR